jgi:2-amino-4-hydroxy-6-hydroxymethyldihydropteridine diphosphokinase
VTGKRRAYLGLGSNLDDRLALLQGAVDALAAAGGVTVVAVSSVYETDPVGPGQPDYLNAVVAVDTALSARELLVLAQALEQAAHRVRKERWGPRTLDVDVLLVGDERVHEPDLEVPHPRLHERAFVRVPLADIAPDVEAALPGRIDPEGVRPTDLRLVVP